jgi:hypothetical protein
VRIGLDFDGTLMDVALAKQQYIKRTWDIDLTIAETGRAGALPVLGEERYLEMVVATHRTESMLETPPVPGALDVTGRLLASHEVVVITARLDEEIELAREWLRRHGLGEVEVVHTLGETKRGAWDRLGTEVHLDDTPRVLVHHPEAMVPALLHTPYNAALERCALTRSIADWLAFEQLVGVLASEGARA